MRVPLVIVTLAIALSADGRSQETYRFLRTDISPRVAAMGGAFVSMQGDPNSLFVNPAALSSIQDDRLSFSYMDHLLDINAGSVSLTLTESPIGLLGLGIVYMHYGSFEQTDQAANQYGTFTASDLAISAATSRTIEENLSLGVALKFIHSSLGDFRSQAVAADLGAIYTIPEERIGIGIALQHAGFQLSTYAGTREPLPTDLRIGITKRPEHLPVQLNFNIHGLNETDRSLWERLRQFSFGAEFEMSSSLRLRLGLNNRVRRDLKLGTSSGLAGFSIGVGFGVSRYLFDYAFNSYGSVGGLHRLGINAPF